MRRKRKALAVKVPATINEAAAAWGVSRTLVYKWILQRRIRHEEYGGSKARAGGLLILDPRPPKIAPRDTLSSAQQACWPGREAKKAKRAKTAPKKERARVSGA